ncbi:MAG: glycosyltransferase family 4 protein [Gemmatimonadaceae bacterium]
MKIAIVTPGGVGANGTDGVIPALVWLLERLASRHEVHVFAFNQVADPATWTLGGAAVHNVGSARAWRRRLLSAFGEEHQRAPFDVIHAFFGWGGTSAALLRARHRIPVVLHLAGGELVDMPDIAYGMRASLRGGLELRIAIAGARRVTVATPFMHALAAEQGIDARIVPLGVALDRWPPRAPRRRDLSEPLRVLHIGDLRPVKDQPMLLAAMRALGERGVNAELDVCGLDTMGGTLQRSVDAALAWCVRWHGHADRGILRGMMERADVLVVTSRHEAGPVAVLEAAVAGVPTVGTAVGHIADWSPDAAWSVRVGDATALADALARLARDEDARLALAHEAQRRALAIDADHTAAAFEQVYHEMTES